MQIESETMTGNAKPKPPTHWAMKQARQEGYDLGFVDGMSQSPDFSKAFHLGFYDGRQSRPKRPRPKLMKALLSSSYRASYFSGYRSGYGAGLIKARQTELKAIAIQNQTRTLEQAELSR